MIIHDVLQGSPEWHSLRLNHLTASEAPAMMGASKYQSRTALLDLKKTGIAPEVDERTQRRFDEGHDTEAKCRAIIEKIIGEELYPIVVSEEIDGLKLLASVDGSTMLGDTLYEHKLWNAELVEQVRTKNLEPHYYWQLEQQLLVTKAERVIFAVSDGTFENCVWMEYRAIGNRKAMLIAGWSQFLLDLSAHQPSAVATIQVIAAPIADLPTIRFELNGLALTSNLEEYREAALVLVDESKRELHTDQDFADAEARIKKFKDAEEKARLVCEQVVGEIKDVDQFVKDLGGIAELIRQARLNSEKAVKARKDSIKLEILQAANKALNEHILDLNLEIGHNFMPAISADFAGVMKAKKTVATLRDAVDTELARAKIEATRISQQIIANLASVKELAADYKFLFADIQQLILKENPDLINLMKQRIADHEHDQAKKRDEESASAPIAPTAESEPVQANSSADTPAATVRSSTPIQSISVASSIPSSGNAPSTQQLIATIAKAYSVHVNVAREWLHAAQLEIAA